MSITANAVLPVGSICPGVSNGLAMFTPSSFVTSAKNAVIVDLTLSVVTPSCDAKTIWPL